MIDNQTVRNRSHAIELLLRESLKTRLTTAVILAGGKRRDSTQPALLPIANQPLIFIALRHLVAYGINNLFILAGDNEATLKAVVGEGDFMGATICYVREKDPLGTAGAVKSIEPRLANEPFLVLHADVLTDIDLSDFIEFHKNEGCMATIAVKPRDAERKYGKLLLQGNRITALSAANQSEGYSIVNTGVYALQPEALSLLEPRRNAQFESDLFPQLAAIGELSAYFFQGIWFDVSTNESYEKAQIRWASR
jgi:mannose-1-phosphate guanylyltransferase/phosphomannomutase